MTDTIQRLADRHSMLEALKQKGLIRGYTITYDSVLDTVLSYVDPIQPVDHIHITHNVVSRKANSKESGFSGIEFLIIFVLVAIVAITILGAVHNLFTGVVTYGPAGVVETRCIDGYKVLVTSRSTEQLRDDKGQRISCTKPN